MEKIKLTLGDNKNIFAPETIDLSELGTLDLMEYKLWEVIKKYMKCFGIKCENPDEPDWDTVKSVQEEILHQFEKAGIKFVYEQTFTKAPQILGATLLSIEEAKKLSKKAKRYKDYWWLTSSGDRQCRAASVSYDGSIYFVGDPVNYSGLCVRPVLIIDLKYSNLKVGDIFRFADKNFKIISKSKAFCLTDIGKHCFRENWEAENANNYEISDVKNFVDEWFEEALRKEVQSWQ